MSHAPRSLTRRAALAAGLVAALAGASSRAGAQPGPPGLPLLGLGQNPPKQSPFAGTYALRFILGEHGLKLEPKSSWAEVEADPEHSLVVLLKPPEDLVDPQTGQKLFDESKLQGFLRGGGAILVASDDRLPAEVQEVFGVHVTGDPVSTQDSAHQYRGKFPDCPLLVMLARHPVFEGITSVATNVPSYIREPEPGDRDGVLARDGRVIARLPPFRPRTWMFGDVRLDLAYRPAFAITYEGAVDQGGPESRVLLLADDSVFIDGMMLQRDNNNFDFAYNCLEWLANHQRKQVLFVDRGTPVTDLSLPDNWKVYPPLPMPPDLLSLADDLISKGGNQLIQVLDESDALNGTILANVPLWRIVSGTAVVLTGALFVLGFARLLRGRYPIDRTAPLFAAVVATQAAARTTLDRRHEAMLSGGHLWEAARDAARHCFESMGALGTVPRVTARTWRQRWRLRWCLHRLRRLADGSQPRRLSRRQFVQVLGWCRRVRAAHADGNLRVDPPTRDATRERV